MAQTVDALDHLVLTVSNIEATVKSYRSVLFMTVERFGAADGTLRTALKFGDQKINLHQAGQEFEPKADRPVPGSADLCFLTNRSVGALSAHLAKNTVVVEGGPILRTGATGPLTSISIREPGAKLIEMSIPTAHVPDP